MQAVSLIALLAAICGLVAASLWVRFAMVPSGFPARSQRILGLSAVATAATLALGSVAVLLAVYAGG